MSNENERSYIFYGKLDLGMLRIQVLPDARTLMDFFYNSKSIFNNRILAVLQLKLKSDIVKQEPAT